jgi:hypothetical protein
MVQPQTIEPPHAAPECYLWVLRDALASISGFPRRGAATAGICSIILQKKRKLLF